MGFAFLGLLYGYFILCVPNKSFVKGLNLVTKHIRSGSVCTNHENEALQQRKYSNGVYTIYISTIDRRTVGNFEIKW